MREFKNNYYIISAILLVLVGSVYFGYKKATKKTKVFKTKTTPSVTVNTVTENIK